jgi:hypothetical protein
MPETASLKLPLLVAEQAQKQVTHNEALRLLDALVKTRVVEQGLTTPPGSPAEGAIYIPGSGATGDWSAWDFNLATYLDGAWQKIVPQVGWLVYDIDQDGYYKFEGDPTYWAEFVSGGGGGSGDVSGPASATDNAVARFDGTGGKTLQDSSFVVDDGGNVSFFGGQIAFPATQNASGNANTLDDYEEGSFTPDTAFGTNGDYSPSYTAQAGVYTKVGRLVYCSVNLVFDSGAYTTASGVFSATGLPFTLNGTASASAARFGGMTYSGWVSIQGPNADTICTFWDNTSGSAPTVMTESNFPASTDITLKFSIVYIV